MAQEFIIKSQAIEDKINQLLPSQGGFQAGVDFSASTQVVPIIDLTETAEGSNVRQDLQTAFSLSNVTAFSVSNTTTTIINTTGYFRIFGDLSGRTSASNTLAKITLTDGLSSKIIKNYVIQNNSTQIAIVNPFDFVVFMQAGDNVNVQTDSAVLTLAGATRQIADINGNLVDP